MRGTSEPFDGGRQLVGLHQCKTFRSRDDPGWSRRHLTIRTAVHRGARLWPRCRRLRGAARKPQLETFMKHPPPLLIAFLLISIPGAKAFGPSGTSVAISITSNSTLLVSPSGSTQIYVTALDLRANTAGNFSLVYGSTTSAPCDTTTVALTGTYNFAAQSSLSKNGGPQPLYVIPAGNALCAVTSGAPTNAGVSMAGSLSYTQY